MSAPANHSLPGESTIPVYHRLATLNVASLAGRLPEVLSLADRLSLTVLCLQETRVRPDSWDAVRRAFRARGWECHFGSPIPQPVGGAGPTAGGLLIATRVPAEPYALPDSQLLHGRALAIRLHFPSARPVLLVNFHGHASDPFAASRAASLLLETVGASGDRWVLAGDHNLLVEQWPYSALLAAGRARAWDDLFILQPHKGTRRHPTTGAYTQRTIDFAVAHPEVVALSRHQEPGPADHDIVTYSIAGSPPQPVHCWKPVRALGGPDHAEAIHARWDHIWATVKQSFESALAVADLDLAWTQLSGVAEEALGAGRGECRAGEPRLGRRDPTGSTKPVKCQPLRERQLRRLLRKARDLHAPRCAAGHSPDLVGRLRANFGTLLAALPSVYSHLRAWDWDDPSCLQRLQSFVDEQAAWLARSRLDHWRRAVQEDVGRLSAWIRADPPAHPPGSPEPPAAIAAQWASTWEQRWRQGYTDLDGLSALLHTVPRQPVPDMQVTPALLRKAVARAVHTSAGLDSWRPADLARLPDTFFEGLARLWTHCLSLGALPTVWRHVRIALVPKPDASMRPIAIAVAAYRVCASATVTALRPWIVSWADPALYGGLPGRSAADLHDRLFGDIHVARTAFASHFFGAKADVRRCFDQLDFEVTFRVFAHLGCPPGLVCLLRHFYATQLRWFSVAGAVHPTPVLPERGLLQGCPFSPALLCATMSVWAQHVRAAAPRVNLGIFLDDRTLWTVGEHDPGQLTTAVRRGAEVDAVTGMKLHPDKLGSFALTARGRSALLAHRALLGEPLARPTLLGITYTFGGRIVCAPAEDVTRRAAHRCRKIAKAARTLALRRKLAVTLVVSLFRWAGPWHRYSLAEVKKWQANIEHVLCGRRPPPARSGFRLWGLYGAPQVHPHFVLHYEALRHQWRVLARHHPAEPPRPTTCPRFKAALAYFAWTAHEGFWTTPFGDLTPGWDAESALHRLAAASWLRLLWADDPKSGGTPPPAGTVPTFDGSHDYADTADPLWRRVVLAAAPDARNVQRLDPAQPVSCDCGAPEATRTHLTFHCPSRPWPGEQRTVPERRLLTPLVPSIPFRRDSRNPPQALVAYLQRRAAAGSTPVILAIDGGCKSPALRALCPRTAWAVSSQRGSFRFSAPLFGPDSTAAYAERSALWHAVAASAEAGVDIALLVDNQAVVRRLCRGLAGNVMGDCQGFWPSNAIAWIPSHDKQQLWEPPAGFPSAKECRNANRFADEAATQALDEHQQNVNACVEALADAAAWAEAALIAQHAVCGPFWGKCLPHWGFERRDGFCNPSLPR